MLDTGQTSIPIVHTTRSAVEIVTSVRKLTKSGLDPWRIIETVHVKAALSGGTIRTTEIQTFTFTRSGASTATFRGRIIGGTGRYAGASGVVSGGGPVVTASRSGASRSTFASRVRRHSRTLAKAKALIADGGTGAATWSG